MKKKIRIGEAGHVQGADPQPLNQQLSGGALDYVIQDFLTETTLSALRRKRQHQPEQGYIGHFLAQLEANLPLLTKKGVGLLTNAGAANPLSLGRQVQGLIVDLGLDLKVGVVYGDDLTEQVAELTAAGLTFANSETGAAFEQIAPRFIAAHAHPGCEPLVAALDAGCRIIITGCVDATSLALAPMIHAFGWSHDAWDRRAAGTIAGHILAGGAMVCGGNLTDWQEVPGYPELGRPIVEMTADGEFLVTKHRKTGGRVCEKSVKEQLVYRLGDPAQYPSADCVALFDHIAVHEQKPDHVGISGVRGRACAAELSVSMAYTDGWRAEADVVVCGVDAQKKATLVCDAFWKALEHTFAKQATTFLGAGSLWPAALMEYTPCEVSVRLAVCDPDRGKVGDFLDALRTLTTVAPAGIAVNLSSGARPRKNTGSWPTHLNRQQVTAKLMVLASEEQPTFQTVDMAIPTTTVDPRPSAEARQARPIRSWKGQTREVPLRRICYGRSGDRGQTVNIGLLARSPKIYDWICENLTNRVVKRFFRGQIQGTVTRYELDTLQGLNFVMEQTLGQSDTATMVIDRRGRTLAAILLEMPVHVPVSLLRGL